MAKVVRNPGVKELMQMKYMLVPSTGTSKITVSLIHFLVVVPVSIFYEKSKGK